MGEVRGQKPRVGCVSFFCVWGWGKAGRLGALRSVRLSSGRFLWQVVQVSVKLRECKAHVVDHTSTAPGKQSRRRQEAGWVGHCCLV